MYAYSKVSQSTFYRPSHVNRQIRRWNVNQAPVDAWQ